MWFWCDFQFFQNFFNFEIFQWFVDDDFYCIIGIMFVNVDYGMMENWILESRYGNKKVML